MKILHTITTNQITLFIDGEQTIINKSHKNFDNILMALRKAKYDVIPSLLKGTIFEKEDESGVFEYENTRVTASGLEIFINNKWILLNTYVTNYIVAEYNSGNKNIKHLLKFVNHLIKNPSKNSVDQLYGFLEHHNLVIDEDGFVVAFKGIKENDYSVMGNPNTIVLQGETNEKGQILNKVGSTIEISRLSCVDNPDASCAEGLHVGSYSFAKGWGTKFILVRFNPADAVSVPNNSTFHKCRVCRYEIIKELNKEKPENKSPVAKEKKVENSQEKLIVYIDRKLKEAGSIMIKTIKKNFKTPFVSEQILGIVNENNYKTRGDNNTPSKVLIVK